MGQLAPRALCDCLQSTFSPSAVNTTPRSCRNLRHSISGSSAAVKPNSDSMKETGKWGRYLQCSGWPYSINVQWMWSSHQTRQAREANNSTAVSNTIVQNRTQTMQKILIKCFYFRHEDNPRKPYFCLEAGQYALSHTVEAICNNEEHLAQQSIAIFTRTMKLLHHNYTRSFVKSETRTSIKTTNKKSHTSIYLINK